MENSQRKCYIVILLITVLNIVRASDEISEHIHKCCFSGMEHARKRNHCDNYDYEVAAIPALWRGLCYSTYGVCCSGQLEKQHCETGRLAALRGSRCDEKFNTASYADCCRACQVGLAVKASDMDCNDLLFSYFGKIESYRICCEEVAMPGTDDSNKTATTDQQDGSISLNESELNASGGDGTIVLEDDDDDICGKVPNLCAHICLNTKEAYECKCNPGYQLDANNVTCTPIEMSTTEEGEKSDDLVDAGGDGAGDLSNAEDEVDDDSNFHLVGLSDLQAPSQNSDLDLEGKDEEVDDDGEAGGNIDENKGVYVDSIHCPLGYKRDELRQKCVDLDECLLKLDSCKSSQYCHNTIGSYRCLNVKTKNCELGYRFNGILEKCEDINECSENLDNCTSDHHCLNTFGSYECHVKDVIVDKQRCRPGYVFNVDTHKCEDYNECNDSVCEDSYICVNYVGHYECKKKPDDPLHQRKVTKISSTGHGYSGAGATSSMGGKCGEGFQFKHGRCVDIDECLVDQNACDSSQVCTNDIGGYHCDCKIGYNLDTTTNACVDINECSINNHNCLPTQRCDNTVGSYICTRLQSCGTGYTLNAETGNCDDDDECFLGTHNCPKDYDCYNTKGSFRCYRRPLTTTKTSTTMTTTATTTPQPQSTASTTSFYPPFYVSRQTYSQSHLRDPSPPFYAPSGHTLNALPPCGIGFRRNYLGACVDINECMVVTPCGLHQRCINTNGSYRCQNLLQCSAGYKATPDGKTCVDIDECETGEHNCAENQICRNRNGGYICSCPPGHQLVSITAEVSRCVDVNECEQERPAVCPSNAQCFNTIGSYYCECKSGFRKSRDSDRICLDVDECQEIPGLCQQKCVNFWGGYRCTCNPGFELAADNRTCNDVDECEVHKSYKLCMGYCDNVPGSYECSCPRGYTLALDKTTCRDVDECATGDYCTGRYDICTNIRGNYRCTSIHCPYGYVNDPDHKNRCRLKLCDQDDCYNKPSAYTYNFITLISKLVIPPEGRIIFSVRGPTWYDDVDFDLKIVKIQAAANIEKASEHHFDTIKDKHEVHLQLKRSLEGPQDIELELTMTVFTERLPRGKSVAKIFIFVSQYTF